MIIIDDLGINISVRYTGRDVADCKLFISLLSNIPVMFLTFFILFINLLITSPLPTKELWKQ